MDESVKIKLLAEKLSEEILGNVKDGDIFKAISIFQNKVNSFFVSLPWNSSDTYDVFEATGGLYKALLSKNIDISFGTLVSTSSLFNGDDSKKSLIAVMLSGLMREADSPKFSEREKVEILINSLAVTTQQFTVLLTGEMINSVALGGDALVHSPDYWVKEKAEEKGPDTKLSIAIFSYLQLILTNVCLIAFLSEEKDERIKKFIDNQEKAGNLK